MPPRINLPPLTRALFLSLLTLSALNSFLRFRKWSASLESSRPSAHDAASYLTSPQWANSFLVLIPTVSIWYPWTFLTAGLVENNIVSVIISGMVVWFGGRYLERAWGSTEFAKFSLFVIVLPNIFAFEVYALWHALTSTPEYPTPIQGLLPLSTGFLIALKQLVPEHTVSLFRSTLRIRIKHFPALFVLANLLSGPLLGTDTAFWLTLAGFVVSWTYLRFFRIMDISSSSASTGGEGVRVRGDASDTFSFVAFFPDVVHPFLAPICDAVWQGLVALKVCTPFSEEAVEAGNERVEAREGGLSGFMNGSGGGGGGRRAEAERRRALALRALDQRLNAAAGGRSSSTGPARADAATSLDAEKPDGAPADAQKTEDSTKDGPA